ncbi:GmrSD restriction endonuclease domain-containing protein [Dysosmobacter sp.]
MQIEKFTPNSLSISAILGLIASGDIAIPEIQRPFVWKKKQVRDLMDSLYKGYPTGYLIIWKNPNVKLKDGAVSAGKKILIDGQQRVTALMTAIAGIPVVNSEYKKERIKIAFDPFEALSTDKDAEIFAVQDQSHLKSKRWIADIAEIFRNDFSVYSFINRYCQDNPEMAPDTLGEIITELRAVGNRMVGVIELSEQLEIDIVTDIFIRINSKGTALSQGDFVMSKIAADEAYGGNMLRKAIDYFAHLSVEPSFYQFIKENDLEFTASEYMSKLAWLKDTTESVYDPDYDDVLRVAFMHKYPRAKLADLVSLLSGRDFETKEFREEITEDTYAKLKDGVLNVINENNFKQFMLAIRGAGFISSKLVNSQMALDFAYTLYLILSKSKEVSVSEVKRIVQRWYVLSVLTGRYSASPETAFYRDLRQIHELGVVKALENIESATLSDNFWNVAVVQDLAYTSTINPTYQVYLAAQVAMKDISLLSNNISVSDLIEMAGDIHHIFPKEYLRAQGFEKNLYNQNANYAYLDTQVNKSIGKKPPKEYFGEAFRQCETKKITCGAITDAELLKENLAANCIPLNIVDMDHTHYAEFLEQRRKLMARKIREYYYSL